MKKIYNLYATEMSPNGTRSLIITDTDGQIVNVIDAAIFGGQFKAQDSMGGCFGVINGDSVGYFEYSCEAYDFNPETQQDVLLEESFCDLLVENGEYQGVELVFPVSFKKALSLIAISPISDGSKTIETLNKYFKKVG